ncbi:hypothetical protein H0H92_005648 [Tricholoma furcatifolium]|nr:hypothetical protein H0H92_005648 [Tricholoma furcatifolium]
MSTTSSASSSRSSSPTLVSSRASVYIPVHKRSKGSFNTPSIGSLTPCSSSSRASTTTLSDSDSGIYPPPNAGLVYSRDILLNLANSPLSRMPQSQRDILRVEVPEVITNRKQRKAIEYFNQMNTVLNSTSSVPSPVSRSSDRRRHHKLERPTPRPIAV